MYDKYICSYSKCSIFVPLEWQIFQALLRSFVQSINSQLNKYLQQCVSDSKMFDSSQIGHFSLFYFEHLLMESTIESIKNWFSLKCSNQCIISSITWLNFLIFFLQNFKWIDLNAVDGSCCGNVSVPQAQAIKFTHQ